MASGNIKLSTEELMKLLSKAISESFGQVEVKEIVLFDRNYNHLNILHFDSAEVQFEK